MDLAQRIAAFSPAAWRRRVEAIGGAIHRIDGLDVMLTGIPFGPFNPTVVIEAPRNPVVALGAAEALYTETHFGIDLDVDMYPSIRRAALQAGLTLEERRAAMAVATDAVRVSRLPDGVEIARVLDEAELDEVARVDVAAFGGEVEYTRRFLPNAVLADPAQRVYAARIDGRIVGVTETGLVDGIVGVFGVGTEPAFRRRGIASALTAHAVLDRRAEADHAVLWPSEMAVGVYEGLGFRATSAWEVWVRKT